jgi:putative protease
MQEHAPLNEREVGVITHYWTHLGVAGIHLTEPVDVGDHIHVMGHTTDFEQDVGSMQIEHHDVRHASPGDDVGIRVNQHAREHDKVFKLDERDIGGDQNEL